MKRIDIFIETSFKGPKKGAGAIAYLLRTKQSGREGTLDKFYRVKESTNNKAELTALMLALGRIREHPCELHVYTDCDYIKNGHEVWSQGWIKNNWKNSRGKPVANDKEWQSVLSLLECHTTTYHIKEHHEFKAWMQEGVKKCLKNLESSTPGKK